MIYFKKLHVKRHPFLRVDTLPKIEKCVIFWLYVRLFLIVGTFMFVAYVVSKDYLLRVEKGREEGTEKKRE